MCKCSAINVMSQFGNKCSVAVYNKYMFMIVIEITQKLNYSGNVLARTFRHMRRERSPIVRILSITQKTCF